MIIGKTAVFRNKGFTLSHTEKASHHITSWACLIKCTLRIPIEISVIFFLYFQLNSFTMITVSWTSLRVFAHTVHTQTIKKNSTERMQTTTGSLLKEKKHFAAEGGQLSITGDVMMSSGSDVPSG